MIFRAIFRGSKKGYAIEQTCVNFGMKLFDIACKKYSGAESSPHPDYFPPYGPIRLDHFYCSTPRCDTDVCMYMGYRSASYAMRNCICDDPIFAHFCECFIDVGEGFFEADVKSIEDDINYWHEHLDDIEEVWYLEDSTSNLVFGSGILKICLAGVYDRNPFEYIYFWSPVWYIDSEELFAWWKSQGFYWTSEVDTVLEYETLKTWFRLAKPPDSKNFPETYHGVQTLPHALFEYLPFRGALIGLQQIYIWLEMPLASEWRERFCIEGTFLEHPDNDYAVIAWGCPFEWWDYDSGEYPEGYEYHIPCEHIDVSGL